jgi:hypothetical protein
MQALDRLQLALLVPLTLVWGFNWPVMRLGVSGYPPLTFRTISLWLGVPVLALVLVAMKTTFRVPRKNWPELLWLSATNMFIWHACIILAVKELSGGRAAILGYTMPVFSAVIGALLFSAVLTRRAWLGVGACGASTSGGSSPGPGGWSDGGVGTGRSGVRADRVVGHCGGVVSERCDEPRRRLAGMDRRHLGQGIRAPLRREPAPAGRVVPALASGPGVRGAVARQGDELQQLRRCRRRLAGGERFRRSRGGDHQARQPLWHRGHRRW